MSGIKLQALLDGNRRALAKARHVVNYNRTRGGVTISEDGTKFVFRSSTSYVSELYNEQISLLCNEQGAALLLNCMEALRGEDLRSRCFSPNIAPATRKLVQYSG